MLEKSLWESFLETVEPHLPEYLHWNEICWTFVVYLAEGRRHIHRWTRGMEAWEIVVWTVSICFAVWLATEVLRFLFRWIFMQDEGFFTRTKKTFFKTLRRLPIIKDKINAEMQKSLDDMEKLAFPENKHVTFIQRLPSKGLKENELMKTLDDNYIKPSDLSWKDGKVSGTVYCGTQELTDILIKVYAKFAWSNPLHPDVFPEVRKMEAEVVRMVLSMFNGDKDCCGTMTGGGTESILLACKAYRDWARERGISKPEIIAPVTAHAAFDKAANYFGFKLVHVPVSKDWKCDMKAMKRAISKNTIALVGSSPQFPHGMIDPIEEMGKLAKKYKLGLHVDACLGGFLVPFMEKAGYDVPLFDFRVEGVTSISADTHKYGYSPKGSSVVMYRNKDLRHHQFFVAPDWPGGIYACPTIPGSRSGGIIASTWAAMMHFGESGYVECTKKVLQTRERIEKGLRDVPGLYVFGEPIVSVVAFGSDKFDIYALGTALTGRGWCLNSLQYPPAIHLCVTLLNTQPGVADRFLKDVRECAAKLLADPNAKTAGLGAIYGMAANIPDRSIVNELACGFLDCMYNTGSNKPQENGRE
ncbi:predicted protein [Nematostella vectensis]|uniref:sphinganine-1-phosphate aldolase n=1 Tax=Nematostella vectensis TaxID=45351 RepID=A7RKY4_NEMVE|nr:predicted protein [Nematostella vectensis]|eukprot:XP_001639902.1 predicted protein [Nematostella vectensis]